MEAQGFRDEAPAFEQAGVTLLGASPDEPDAQQAFKEKLDLPFPLLCDPEGSLARAWGVARERGVARETFLVDADGRVARRWANVAPSGHAGDVLAAARALS